MRAFDYENLSGRRPGPVMTVAQRLLPGVREVSGQTPRYAAWWRERNLDALSSGRPLWVVLGDSMSIGIGASDVRNGWVPRCASTLDDGLAVLNLAFSGARTQDVIDRQWPAFRELGRGPAARVTLSIGSNDLLRPSNRAALAGRAEQLLASLPDGTFVATVPHATGALRVFGDLVAASEGRLRNVPLLFSRGGRAPDGYHPDDEAYAGMADEFAAAIRAAPR